MRQILRIFSDKDKNKKDSIRPEIGSSKKFWYNTDINIQLKRETDDRQIAGMIWKWQIRDPEHLPDQTRK